jgi:signal peptidase I
MGGRLAKVGIGLLMVPGAVLALVLIVLPATGTMKSYRAPSESMLPTIAVGERFLVLQAAYDPKVGDVVVARVPAGAIEARCGEDPPTSTMCTTPTTELSNTRFVQRIAAGPGDRVRMEGGKLFRNGRPERGYEVRPCEGTEACEFPQETTIPKDHWLLLGDNRGASSDSRFWGPVPTRAIEGRKLLTYWKG